MATLYVVGTPIGNLEDVSLRALRILNEVDVIVCEDTRVTKKLLFRFGISKPLLSYHSQSKLSKVNEVIGMLEAGKNVALVSDAGTPAISDPGALLVAEVREKLGGAVKIEAVPGPSAVAAALSVAGVPASQFLFLGFLPHKKGRATLFREIAEATRTVVCYESPHRLMKTLESLAAHAPAKRLAVAKELTKIHEEVVRGTAGEVVDFMRRHKDKIRGEFVLVIF